MIRLRAAMAASACSLCVAACAPSERGINLVFDACEPIVLLLPGDASSSEISSIEKGLESWNSLANTQFEIGMAGSDNVLPIEFDTAAGNFFGVYDDTNGRVIVNRTLMDPDKRAVTVAHELGHAMGLVHVDPDARVSVMNMGNTATPPNDADAEAVRALWGDCAG